MPALLYSFVCLFTSLNAFANDYSPYFVDRDDRTPELIYRGTSLEYGFKLNRALDGRVVAQFDLRASEREPWNRLTKLASNLSPQMEVTLEEPFMAVFDLHGRVFGILEDLRLVEFRLSELKLSSGHFWGSFYHHGGISTLSGLTAVGCLVGGQSFLAGALTMFSAGEAVKAYESQRGCDVQLEVYQWSGPHHRPFFVKEVQTQHQLTPFPPVSEVIIQLEGEPPHKLTELIELGEAECATLLMRQRLQDRPGV